MHRVLAIAEILRCIFGLLGKQSNARNARVCKAWSSIALDCVWESIEPSAFLALCPTNIMESQNEDDDTKTVVR